MARLHRALEAEREHWFVFLPVLFGLGVGIYFSLPQEPPAWAVLVPLALSVIAYRSSRGLLAIVTGMAVIVSAGVLLAKARTEWVRAPMLEKRLSGADIRGYVVLVEDMPKRGQRLTLNVTAIEGIARERLPSRVRIRAMTALAGAKPGDAIHLRATLSPPAGPALPAGYDFARTAWYLRLGGVGYSLSAPKFDPEAGPPPWPMLASATIERTRQAIGARILAALPGETGGIANALITGARGGITNVTNDAFRDAGIFHILSISGLHMVITAGAVFFVIRLLLAAVPPLALRYPIKKWAAAAAAVAALGYLLMSGSEFATVRSYIMISIMFLAILLDRPVLAMRNVALAAFLILVLYPESLLDVGFQMSFAAVVALISAYAYIAENRSASPSWQRSIFGRLCVFFGGIVLSTIVAGVAVAPFTAYHFHTSQQYAVISNLIAIPLCNVIVMPMALLAFVLMPFGLEWIALYVMGIGIDAMVWCANWTAHLPGAVSHIRAIPLSSFLAMVAGGLWLSLWQTRWRTLGIIPIAAGFALAPFMPRPDVLVGRDGALVAVRGDTDGRYTALAARNSNFELKRWLEDDGDPRQARQATYSPSSQTGFNCDAIGCNTAVKSHTLAVVRHPAALRDDCARADILILDIPRPSGCNHPKTVIDFFGLRGSGTHAIYFESADKVRIETVAQYRGDRPWAPAPKLPQPRIVNVPASKPPPSADPPASEPAELRPDTEGEDDPHYDQE